MNNEQDFRTEDQNDEIDMDLDSIEEMDFDDDEVDMESVSAHPAPRSMLRRAGEMLLPVLQNNFVWYAAGLVDGLILFKLFGG